MALISEFLSYLCPSSTALHILYSQEIDSYLTSLLSPLADVMIKNFNKLYS